MSSFLPFLAIGGVLVLMMSLGAFFDSSFATNLAFRRIRKYCEKHGCSEIKPIVNQGSFGVWFVKSGKKYRGKMTVNLITWRVTFLKNDPAKIP